MNISMNYIKSLLYERIQNKKRNIEPGHYRYKTCKSNFEKIRKKPYSIMPYAIMENNRTENSLISLLQSLIWGETAIRINILKVWNLITYL